MIDYLIDEESRTVIDRDEELCSSSEFWRFRQQDNEWYLDEINTTVSLTSLHRLESYSEVAGS